MKIRLWRRQNEDLKDKIFFFLAIPILDPDPAPDPDPYQLEKWDPYPYQNVLDPPH